MLYRDRDIAICIEIKIHGHVPKQKSLNEVHGHKASTNKHILHAYIVCYTVLMIFWFSLTMHSDNSLVGAANQQLYPLLALRSNLTI